MESLRFPKPVRRTPPLKAGQHRRKYIRAKRPRRLDGPHSDPAWLTSVRLLPCALLKFDPEHVCRGRIEACHEAKKPGVGMKCADRGGTMPMCAAAHDHWTRHVGFFRGWPKEKRRAWADERIAETTALLLSHGGRRGS